MNLNSFPWLAALWLLILGGKGYTQIKLHTEDLPRFYQAFDSVVTTADTAKQLAFIQQLYVDKASSGLKEFMELRGGNTREWRNFIVQNQAALREKRPHILSVLTQKPEMLKRIALFKSYYPDFRDGDIYFCVGINNSGGTIRDKTVYIGTEVAASSSPNWSVYLVLHEFVHTQQWTQRHLKELLADSLAGQQYMNTHRNLLGKCLEEGMADFVAELVLGKPLSNNYMTFGQKHEQSIWKEFHKDMHLPFDHNKGWLYAERTIEGEVIRDIGYFIGYKICKSYYDRTKDKKEALSYMIGLNLTDDNAKHFLISSGYNPVKKTKH
jgi:hypothetical protein